jgi:hypothetical protein
MLIGWSGKNIDMLKKYKKILFVLTLVVIFLFILFYGLLKLRESRMWPFNSTLSRFFPSSVKYFAYKVTSPNKKLTTSFLYNINVGYHSIPDIGAIGGGGSINNIDKNRMIVTLNNGQSLAFDYVSGKFETINSLEVKKIFHSVRDVFVFDKSGNKYLAFFGTTDQGRGCKRVSIYLAKLDVPKFGLNFSLGAPNKLWETEDACDSPVDNNAGGRIVYHAEKFYVSTGFFMGDASALGRKSDFMLMDKNSSFGKIIEVDWSGYSRIISSGHRNPQGLFFAKNSKILFSTEHSIRGGDELNLIKNSTNYGFPCEAFSTYYSYDFIFPQKDKKLIGKDPLCLNKRFEPPIFYWPDKTGISQGVEYAGDEFPAFVGDLLIGSLAGHSLFRIQLGEANNVMFIERINLQERVRDLNISDSGKIIILTDGGSILVLSSAK